MQYLPALIIFTTELIIFAIVAYIIWKKDLKNE
jgi:hypothetical protein